MLHMTSATTGPWSVDEEAAEGSSSPSGKHGRVSMEPRVVYAVKPEIAATAEANLAS